MEPGVLAYAAALGGRYHALYKYDPRMQRLPGPGLQVTVVGRERAVPVRFNRLGLRGPELDERSGPRWLVVGDSFTLAVAIRE